MEITARNGDVVALDRVGKLDIAPMQRFEAAR
jgi:hypothetical protein